MIATFRYLLCLIPLAVATTATAQTVIFQEGRELIVGNQASGIIYGGTDDSEFRSAGEGLTTPQGDNDEITVDGEDGGNVTQAALRFSNLLDTDGGVIPSGVIGGGVPISSARLLLWVTSNSDSEANIEFHRVINEDNDSGEFWTENDTFASLTAFVAPLPAARRFSEYPFNGQFDDANDSTFKPSLAGNGFSELAEPSVRLPRESEAELLEGLASERHAGTESEDILGEIEDDVFVDQTIGITQALNLSFFELDVTSDVQSWLRDGAPLQGWAITNDTGNGWDFFTSEKEGIEGIEYFDGETGGIPGVDFDPSDGLDPLPPEFAYIDEEGDPIDLGSPDPLPTPAGIAINSEFLRPILEITFQGGNGPADINFDQLVNEDDLALFLENFGKQIDNGGALPAGTPGDLDNDLDVDPADFLIFKEAFNSANPVLFAELFGGPVSVPEPSTVVLAALACVALGVHRCRQSA